LLEKKVSNILLNNAQDNLLNQQIHRISIAELTRQADFNSHDIKLIKEAIINLEKTLVKWDLLDVDNDSEW